MAVSKRLRYEILRRDNHACRYCGAMTDADTRLTIDHVVPVALGGQDIPENLVTACADCNAGKAASSADSALVADVAEDALRWRKAMEVAQEISARERQAKQAFLDGFYEEWRTWHYTTFRGETVYFDLPPDWRDKVAELANGLTLPEIVDCINIAMAAKRVDDEFRYFLGVARNKLGARQLVAQELIRRGVV